MLILSSPSSLQRQFIFSLIFEHRIRSVINGIRREVADDDAAAAALAAQVVTQLQTESSSSSSSNVCSKLSAQAILPSQRQP